VCLAQPAPENAEGLEDELLCVVVDFLQAMAAGEKLTVTPGIVTGDIDMTKF
jgi:hypothetical protein